MGILDNFEAWVDIDTVTEYSEDQCFYCKNESKYTDIAPKDVSTYMNIGVCSQHFVQVVTS